MFNFFLVVVGVWFGLLTEIFSILGIVVFRVLIRFHVHLSNLSILFQFFKVLSWQRKEAEDSTYK